MRIVHLLHEFPFPPTSGIRCDMGRRLAAFAELGHQIFAVSWASAGTSETPDASRLAELDAMVLESHVLPIGRGYGSKLRRLWHMRRHPSYVAARIPSADERARLIERITAFGPDVIWLEGVHPVWLALELQRVFQVPLLYRSHNIEHRYVAEQARLARSRRLRLALTAGTWGLERMERALYGQAQAVYDISIDDLRWWQQQGFERGHWLAPQADRSIMDRMAADPTKRTIDLLFLGSLSSPNNVAGLFWFVNEIHPLVKAQHPDIRVVVAGRRPGNELAELLKGAGIELVADPIDAAPLYAEARVMMNPILHGSGVNIKTVDMLASGRPVVTTAKGARGLPGEVVRTLRIATSAQEFAKMVVGAVSGARAGEGGDDRRAMMDELFGTAAVEAALRPFQAGLGIAP